MRFLKPGRRLGVGVWFWGRWGGKGIRGFWRGWRVHEETLRELESHAFCSRGEHAPDALVDLEVVVGREHRDCGVQKRVVKD